MKKNNGGWVWLDIIGAMVFFLFVLIGTFILLFIPAVFEFIYGEMGFKDSYEVHAGRITHMLWDKSDFRDLPVIGRLMQEKEVIHFQDIRTIIQRMIVGFWVALGVLLALGLFLNWKRVLIISAAIMILICATCGIWAAVNWLHMFETLHYWLFQNDSWRLPDGCVTLILFPYKVWEVMGAIVLGIVVITHIFAFLIAWLVPKGVAALHMKKASD